MCLWVCACICGDAFAHARVCWGVMSLLAPWPLPLQVSFRWHHDRSRLQLKGLLSIQFIQAMLGRLWAVPGASFSVLPSLSLKHTHAHAHTDIRSISNTLSWSLSNRAGRLHYPPVRSMLAMTGSSAGHPTIDTADSTVSVCRCVCVSESEAESECD